MTYREPPHEKAEHEFLAAWWRARLDRSPLLRLLDIARLIPRVLRANIHKAECELASEAWYATPAYREWKAARRCRVAQSNAAEAAARAKLPPMSDADWRETRRKQLFGYPS